MQHESPVESLIQEAAERRRVREEAEYRAGFKAMQLAPTLDIYHALLRGEDVPVGLLRQNRLAKYGMRRRDAA